MSLSLVFLVFQKYKIDYIVLWNCTEHQNKPVTSLEQHSLKFKTIIQMKIIIFSLDTDKQVQWMLVIKNSLGPVKLSKFCYIRVAKTLKYKEILNFGTNKISCYIGILLDQCSL